MDEGEGSGGGGGGGDSMEQVHRNEAISAVTDEGFVEDDDEDDDYDDLYNDVNVGDGFFHSLSKNGDNNVKPQDSAVESTGVAIPGVGCGGGGGGEVERNLEVEGGGDGENVGFGGSDVGMKGSENVNGDGMNGNGVHRGYGGGGGLRVELAQNSVKVSDVGEQAVSNSVPLQGVGLIQQSHGMNVGNVGNGVGRHGGGVGVGVGGSVNGTGGANIPVAGSGNVSVGSMGAGMGVGGGGSGSTVLFVGDLHWWTTDSELEAELVKYGPVKEVRFFDEKASGKSKGYCQVELYDPAAAAACKEGMNGHVFNGRPCVVAFATPLSIKRMGDAQLNRNQLTTQGPNQARRGPNDVLANNKPTGSNIATGGNYQGPEQNRNFGRGNWGRGNPQGMGNRGGPVGPIRNRPGGMGGRGIMGNNGGPFGQGMGPTPLMPHQAMMGQGFDPGFGGPMGRMGNFGGFPAAPGPPFQGMMSSFGPMGNVGLNGVAPHVNPAFFGRGMPMNGMGMMPNAGIDGPNMGMWPDPNMGGWAGDEHGGGRGGESSYGEEAASDHQYGEAGGWQNNPMKDKDRVVERDFSGSSDRRPRDDKDPSYERDTPREKEVETDWPEKRHRDDRDGRDRERMRSRDREHSRERERERSRDRDRDRYRDERERYGDHHKYRDREADYDVEWERGRSSRTHSKSRVPHEEEQRLRSRDAEYVKRRRE